MAVREYVGARYVPLFADPAQWSDARTYEPLTIVINEGNSYTSRQYVPLGTPITNENYWALTGNYNAQVEQYRQEVKLFDGRIQTNANDIATLNVKVNDDIAALNVKINDDVAALNVKINDIGRTCAIYIGNSYTAGVGSTAGKGIFALTKDCFDEAHMYVAGGAGFLPTSYQSKTFVTLLQEAVFDAHVNNADVTHVFFVGAWGESSALAQYGPAAFYNNSLDAVKSAADMIKREFPNIEKSMYFWAESREFPITGTDGPHKNPYYTYQIHLSFPMILKQVMGIQYGGWVGWPLLYDKSTFHTDNYHPNDKGYSVLASEFISSVRGSMPEYKPKSSVYQDAFSNFIEGMGGGSIEILETPYETTYNFNDVTTGAIPANFTPKQFNNPFELTRFFTYSTKTAPGYSIPYVGENKTMPVGTAVFPVNITDVNDVNNMYMVLYVTIDNQNNLSLMCNPMKTLPGTKSEINFSGLTRLCPSTITVKHTVFNREI